MNYVKHLNHWFEELRLNNEAKPTHVSLYFGLFQMWNANRFPEKFVINRYEMMVMTKIGSKTTYSKMMQDLHKWGWINYLPSQSKYGLSTIQLFNMSEKGPSYSAKSGTGSETSNGTSSDTSSGTRTEPSNGTSSGQVVGHNNKTINSELINNKKNNKYDEEM